MAWLPGTGSPITISKTNYVEWREDPDDPEKRQYRNRATIVTEYRGIDATAAEASVGSPAVGPDNTIITRSFTRIEAGGGTVTETADGPTSSWIDEPT